MVNCQSLVCSFDGDLLFYMLILYFHCVYNICVGAILYISSVCSEDQLIRPPSSTTKSGHNNNSVLIAIPKFIEIETENWLS